MTNERGAGTEMDAPRERSLDLVELEKILGAEMSDFEAPCTGAGTGECWIFENLTPWNCVLKKIGYAIDEFETGKAILRPMNTFILVSPLEDFVQMGFLLFYKLLKGHRCVRALEVAGHLATIQCVSIVNAAIAESTGLESLKVVSSPEDPHHGEPLVEGIKNLTALQHLTLEELALSTSSAKKVAKMLANNRYLKSIRLSALKADACDVAAILVALAGLKDLTELAFVKGGLNTNTAKALGTLINEAMSIAKLDLSEHWDLRMEAYVDHGGANEEDLPNRQEGLGEAMKILCDALTTNNTVKVLHLSNTSLYDDGAKHLAAALKKNTTIQEVCVEMSLIGNEGTEALADMLKSNNTLEVLNMNFNQIYEGGYGLPEAIALNRKLRKLSLCGASFGLSTCCAFINALDQNSTLEQVNIGQMDDFKEAESEEILSLIRDRHVFHRMEVGWNKYGLRELARALERLDDIRKVEVGWTEDSAEEETRQVFEAVSKNPSVAELHILLEEIPQQAVTALAQLLKTTKTLKKVKIPLQVSDMPVVDAVMDALAENTSITYLELMCYMLNRHAEEKLGSMLKRNQSIHTLVMDDASTEFSIGEDTPHMSLARDLESNWTLLNVRNSHAWFPQEGLFRIEEVLRRNRRLLHHAAAFVLKPVLDRKLAKDFQVLSGADSLVEHLAKVTAKKDIEVRKAVCEAQDFVKQNFIDL